MNPLVIMDAGGRVRSVLACNEKSRAKSLEQNELWILRPDNGRVLPWRGGGVRCGTFRQRDGEGIPWYEVEVHLEADGGDTADPEPRNPPSGGDRPAALPVIPVLTDLADLIADRRRVMPEGSYTTHLFRQGPSKIRKKTGEEAVELILAETRDEVISETADLLYHALILLESEGVRIEDVLAELSRRHRS
ncbi:MAG: phosphoribosyl-ATP diphosphatase [Spirochaetaceae bacterium]|nr:MAG: phosphoribosyl-ATP diphosphatase [Spirochaetaceae bacterium]